MAAFDHDVTEDTVNYVLGNIIPSERVERLLAILLGKIINPIVQTRMLSLRDLKSLTCSGSDITNEGFTPLVCSDPEMSVVYPVCKLCLARSGSSVKPGSAGCDVESPGELFKPQQSASSHFPPGL